MGCVDFGFGLDEGGLGDDSNYFAWLLELDFGFRIGEGLAYASGVDFELWQENEGVFVNKVKGESRS